MTTHTISGWVQAQPARKWERGAHVIGGMKFEFWTHENMTAQGYLMVCPHTMTFDLPDAWDPRQEQVAALEAKKAELQARYSEAMAMLNQQISELLAIEHTPAEAIGSEA